MATRNPFELLGDEETDASAVIERAAAMEKVRKKQHQQEERRLPKHQDLPKLPSKPLPPSQAVRELKAGQQDVGRGRVGQGRTYANRDFNGRLNYSSQEGFQNRGFDRSDGYRREGDEGQGSRSRFHGQGRPVPTPAEDGEAEHLEGGHVVGRFRGGVRRQGRFGENTGGFGEGQQQRVYIRKDALGRPQEAEAKLEVGDVVETEVEKQSVIAGEPTIEMRTAEEKKAQEDEDNEMLLEEYYKVLDEKTKYLKSLKSEERKVVVDKEFEKMTVVERKHEDRDFARLGSEKDKGKKKEVTTSKDEKAKKNMTINEFLKPVEGELLDFGNRRGRGRGGRGGRGSEGYRGGFGGNYTSGHQSDAPRIEDLSQFPTLGAASSPV